MNRTSTDAKLDAMVRALREQRTPTSPVGPLLAELHERIDAGERGAEIGPLDRLVPEPPRGMRTAKVLAALTTIVGVIALAQRATPTEAATPIHWTSNFREATPIANVRDTTAPTRASTSEGTAPTGAPTRDSEVSTPEPSHATNGARTRPRRAPAERPHTDHDAELRLLQRAYRQIDAGAHADALRVLDELRQRFADGQLGHERDAARLIALCGAGRMTEARTAMVAFTIAHPASPYTSRINETCGDGVTNPGERGHIER